MCGIHLQVLKEIASKSNDGDHSENSDIDDCGKTSGKCTCPRIFRAFNDHDNKKSNLERRGPDSYHEVLLETISSISTPNNSENMDAATTITKFGISLHASVLQMRHECISQPVSLLDNESNNVENHGDGDPNYERNTDHGPPYLCWNGELYQMVSTNTHNEVKSTSEDVVVEDVWQYNQSDTTIVANILSKVFLKHHQKRLHNQKRVSSRYDDDNEAPTTSTPPSLHQDISDVMKCFINAEFAFVVVTDDAVYYGRDVWGRRSLLHWICPICGSFRIASVAEDYDAVEGVTNGIVDICGQTEDTNSSSAALNGWSEIAPGQVVEYRFDTHATSVINFSQVFERCMSDIKVDGQRLDSVSITSPQPTIINGVSERMWKASFLLEEALTSALAMRLDRHKSRPHAAILFSGGLDSVVLAALAIKSAAATTVTSQSDTEGNQDARQPNGTNNCVNLRPRRRPILLYNVSFGPDYAKSNDRKAALLSYQTLQRLFPDQLLVFRDIVVDWDTIKQKEAHIRKLLLPKETLMDVNIATALWFASRGEEFHEVNDNDCDNVPDGLTEKWDDARVLLVGMGADEQLGGYGRHRKAFAQNGWEGLRQELNMDQSRLWERNLGRDCRICSDHGKEARFPYLDYHVVKLLRELPLQYVCDFDLPPGQGDKRLLRLVASRLGLDHASSLVKRAIQFGSRISHLCDSKLYGSRRRAKGQAVVSRSPKHE